MVWEIDSERTETEIKSNSTFFRLRVFVETSCRSYRAKSFSQTRFPTVNMAQNTQVEIENRHFCSAKTKVMSVHRHLISIYLPSTIWKVRSRGPSPANLNARKYSEYSDKQMSTCPALPLNFENIFLLNVNMINVAICYQNILDYRRNFKNRVD
jgi:hypothetical protein